ncbi:MAG: DNA primase [Oligoflexus sp.]
MSIEIAKQRILSQVQLAEVIGEKIPLQRKAGRFVGLCPFHADKNPSFTIFDDHYFCFGCRARGDVINFIQQDQGLGFIEALKYLAHKYNIAAPELEQSIQDHGQRQQLANLYQILQRSQEYFLQQLASPEAESCRRYLEQRGFSQEAIKQFEFGFAPDRPTGLVSFLLRQGFQLQDCVSASVATVAERDRKTYDFYRHRLMIPIRDHYGRIIAFGGRTLGDDQAKYKNSRETALFDKGRVLYGFDQAKQSIRQKRRAIVVEGYMDALQLRNHGLTETVACLGTALTIHHAKRLSQICQKVYLVFDGDEAGKRASLKAVDLAMSLPQMKFHVIRLNQKDDPDSFIKREGAEAFESLVLQAQDLLEYAIESRLDGAHDTAIPELVRQEFGPWIQSVKDPLQQSYLISRIAQATAIPRDDIASYIQNLDKKPGASAKPQQASKQPIPADEAPLDPPVKIIDRPPKRYEEALIGHLYFAKPDELDLGEVRSFVEKHIAADSIWHELTMELIQALRRQKVPEELGPCHWRASSSEYVLTTLEDIQKKAAAFVCTNRMDKIQQILSLRSTEDKRQTIKALQKSLAQASPQEQRDILITIQELYREI